VNPALKRFLIPFLIVDALFFLILAAWLLKGKVVGGKPDIQIETRHPEPKLTEIDLINKGTGAGPIFIAVDVSWVDADLVDAKGVSQFGEIDTGRHSVRFYPLPALKSTTLSPGSPWAVGWIKLTDDVPLHADISADTTTQP
jgi:hypothetical protein